MTVDDNTRLDALLEFDPGARATIESSAPTGDVSTLQGPKGPVVAIAGRRIHSSRNPEREANRWVRELELTDATVIIVFGLGSGYHIRAIERRSDARIVVYEPNLDVIREGVSHGPLSDQVRVFASERALGTFLATSLSGADRGLLATWPGSGRLDPPAYARALQAASDAVGRAKLRHRTACLRGRGWLAHYLTNLAELPSCVALPQLTGAMKGRPAIIVAAGPSLDRNIDQLGALAEDALILSVNTAARALDRKGLQPHALVSIESADVTAGLKDLPWLTEVPAFVELTGHPAIWALPVAAKVAVSVDTNACAGFSNRIAPGLGISAGFCVANAAVSIAQTLGCDPIILVGSDLAYADGRVYAAGTMFESMRAEATDTGDGRVSFSGMESRREIESASADALGGNRMPSHAHTLEVPGWNQTSSVVTTRDFVMFRDWYSYFAGEHPDTRFINATEGGAFIEGWEHISLREASENFGSPASSPGTGEQFAQALRIPPVERDRLEAELRPELDRTREILGLARQALGYVRHDPDGDLVVDEQVADELQEINARVRRQLKLSPLAGEAAFSPIEELRVRGDITTYSFYASLIGPLEDLEQELARLLQVPCDHLGRVA